MPSDDAIPRQVDIDSLHREYVEGHPTGDSARPTWTETWDFAPSPDRSAIRGAAIGAFVVAYL